MPNQQEQKWPSVFQYMLRPQYELAYENLPLAALSLKLFLFFLLMMAVNYGQMIFLVPIMDILESQQDKFNEAIDPLMQNPTMLILIVAIIPSITEELWFRFGLRLYSRLVMLLWSALMIGYLLFLDVSENGLIDNHFTTIFIGIFILISLYFWHFNIDKIHDHYQRYFPYIFWFSSFTFGFIHIFNFSPLGFEVKLIYLYMVYIIGRSLLGAILAYIRMRFGFGYAILIHMVNNLSAAIFMLIAYHYGLN